MELLEVAGDPAGAELLVSLLLQLAATGLDREHVAQRHTHVAHPSLKSGREADLDPLWVEAGVVDDGRLSAPRASGRHDSFPRTTSLCSDGMHATGVVEVGDGDLDPTVAADRQVPPSGDDLLATWQTTAPRGFV